MFGRLIVALLVVASAAFVMLQKRATESTDIQANLSQSRAHQSDARAAALAQEVTTLREQVRALEHDLEWQRGQLAGLAADCTPAAPDQPKVHVAKLTWRPPRAGHAWPSGQRVSLLLGGDEATITRIRLFTSLDDGTAVNDFVACDTLQSESGVLLGVIAGGKDVVEEFGPQRIAKRRGVVPFELVCDSELDADQPLTVDVLLAGGASARATVAPKAAPASR
ncbi:MAG: hypothetical protein A2138_06550 [Deltaproteobacteria bacterium RBG_16_71_12]|nr:MAG: hypothetical protein A2138_06550 [Deltaproteobacteria bacterium RBG_16_71_12]